MSFSFDIPIHASGSWAHIKLQNQIAARTTRVSEPRQQILHTHPHTTTEHPRTTHRSTRRLTVTPEREGVVPLPRLAAAGRRLVVAVALAETARLLAGGGEATGFAVLL